MYDIPERIAFFVKYCFLCLVIGDIFSILTWHKN